MQEQKPKVGVGVMIIKGGNVLLGKRKGSHGKGEYSFPGGHLEYMESFENCIKREVLEEAGIEIKNIKFLYVANIKQYAPKHYVHLGFTAEWASGEPKILEPEKHEAWGWYDLDNLPQPLFAPSKFSVEMYKNGLNYLDK